jgi:hypothetical protein
MQDLKLVSLLAEKIGIKTAGELEEFKKRTQADTNEKLLKRLALYVACDMTYKEAVDYK